MILALLVFIFLLFVWFTELMLRYWPLILVVVLGLMIVDFVENHWVITVVGCFLIAAAAIYTAWHKQNRREHLDNTKEENIDFIKEDFKRHHAVELADGFFLDEPHEKILVILDGKREEKFLVENFSDIVSYKIVGDDEIHDKREFAIHFADMADNEKVHYSFSMSYNDDLESSPATQIEFILRSAAEKNQAVADGLVSTD